jgi:hypothetical protein
MDITYTVFPDKNKIIIDGDFDKYAKAMKVIGAIKNRGEDSWNIPLNLEDNLVTLITKLGGNPQKQKTVQTSKKQSVQPPPVVKNSEPVQPTPVPVKKSQTVQPTPEPIKKSEPLSKKTESIKNILHEESEIDEESENYNDEESDDADDEESEDSDESDEESEQSDEESEQPSESEQESEDESEDSPSPVQKYNSKQTNHSKDSRNLREQPKQPTKPVKKSFEFSKKPKDERNKTVEEKKNKEHNSHKIANSPSSRKKLFDKNNKSSPSYKNKYSSEKIKYYKSLGKKHIQDIEDSSTEYSDSSDDFPSPSPVKRKNDDVDRMQKRIKELEKMVKNKK